MDPITNYKARNFTCTKRHVIIVIIFTVFVVFQIGCKKLVDVNPPTTSTTGASVFTNDPSAIAAVTGMYAQISSGNSSFATGTIGISLLAGLSADELSLYGGVSSNDIKYAYYTNSLYANTTATNPGTENWNTLY